MPLNTNYRFLKTEGKRWQTSKKDARTGVDLCTYCAVNGACPVQEVGTVECDQFVPAIAFRGLDGLDAPLFNTFRVGSTWSKRLSVGSRVVVWDSIKSRKVTDAIVRGVHIGSLQDMAREHGRMNHLSIGEDFIEALFVYTVTKIFGAKIIHDRKGVFTVIYLEPCPEPAA